MLEVRFAAALALLQCVTNLPQQRGWSVIWLTATTDPSGSSSMSIPSLTSESTHQSDSDPAASGDSARGSVWLRLSAWMNAERALLVTVGVSLVVHLLLIAILAFIIVPTHLQQEIFTLLAQPMAEDSDAESQSVVDVIVMPEKLNEGQVNDTLASVDVLQAADTVAPVALDFNDDPITTAITEAEAESVMRTLRGDFGGRSEKGKLAALRKYGGTADSEGAVNAGLRWLAALQAKDGSWDFREVGDAGNPGQLANGKSGATAMALLCFLGAGHSHKSKTAYATNVRKGLEFLVQNATFVSNEADLRLRAGGNSGMYIQGLATIALCEAHALTRRRGEERNLKRTAQAAIRFIEEAQHSEGGWRYRPGEAGDTSVVGWQIMALKSGQAGGLRVDSRVYSNARRFLDRVQVDEGSMYGYTGPQPNRPGTTAVGLLCRMYLGWRRDRPALRRGVEFLSKRGPDRNDMYYNYYATQVLHHWGGDEWKAWNEKMRPMLVQSQVRKGPATGSWNPRDRHAAQGGRIYQTALSIMTLEVYYRHLPLYRRTTAVEADEKAD